MGPLAPLRMPKQSERLPPEPLTTLQRQAVVLLADGVADEKVAELLQVPLAWVESLEQSLPVAAAVLSHQHRRFQAHRDRVRNLLERALDVAEIELAERPTPELALGLLKALKLEAPTAPLRSAEQLLLAECNSRAEVQLQAKQSAAGFGSFSFIAPADVAAAAGDLFRGELHRLSAPADPEAVA